MRISAYVLAGDPTWVERSVGAYYEVVERLVVSYDVDDRGWTGAQLSASAVVERLRSLDVDHKMIFLPGSFHDNSVAPLHNDTAQRAAALSVAGEGMDWVLQLDTDEVLPDMPRLLDVLARVDDDVLGVEWPMSVLFRGLRGGAYLQVCSAGGAAHVEYPGSVAVRPTAKLVQARRHVGVFERVLVAGDTSSLQVVRASEAVERRSFSIPGEAAILHNSWGRSPAVVWRKVRSWGHNEGLRSLAFYFLVWLPSPLTSRILRNFHPLNRTLWPRLRRLPAESVGVHP